jgi:hypothetical protein
MLGARDVPRSRQSQPLRPAKKGKPVTQDPRIELQEVQLDTDPVDIESEREGRLGKIEMRKPPKPKSLAKPLAAAGTVLTLGVASHAIGRAATQPELGWDLYRAEDPAHSDMYDRFEELQEQRTADINSDRDALHHYLDQQGFDDEDHNEYLDGVYKSVKAKGFNVSDKELNDILQEADFSLTGTPTPPAFSSWSLETGRSPAMRADFVNYCIKRHAYEQMDQATFDMLQPGNSSEDYSARMREIMDDYKANRQSYIFDPNHDNLYADDGSLINARLLASLEKSSPPIPGDISSPYSEDGDIPGMEADIQDAINSYPTDGPLVESRMDNADYVGMKMGEDYHGEDIEAAGSDAITAASAHVGSMDTVEEIVTALPVAGTITAATIGIVYRLAQLASSSRSTSNLRKVTHSLRSGKEALQLQLLTEQPPAGIDPPLLLKLQNQHRPVSADLKTSCTTKALAKQDLPFLELGDFGFQLNRKKALSLFKAAFLGKEAQKVMVDKGLVKSKSFATDLYFDLETNLATGQPLNPVQTDILATICADPTRFTKDASTLNLLRCVRVEAGSATPLQLKPDFHSEVTPSIDALLPPDIASQLGLLTTEDVDALAEAGISVLQGKSVIPLTPEFMQPMVESCDLSTERNMFLAYTTIHSRTHGAFVTSSRAPYSKELNSFLEQINAPVFRLPTYAGPSTTEAYRLVSALSTLEPGQSMQDGTVLLTRDPSGEIRVVGSKDEVKSLPSTARKHIETHSWHITRIEHALREPDMQIAIRALTPTDEPIEIVADERTGRKAFIKREDESGRLVLYTPTGTDHEHGKLTSAERRAALSFVDDPEKHTGMDCEYIRGGKGGKLKRKLAPKRKRTRYEPGLATRFAVRTAQAFSTATSRLTPLAVLKHTQRGTRKTTVRLASFAGSIATAVTTCGVASLIEGASLAALKGALEVAALQAVTGTTGYAAGIATGKIALYSALEQALVSQKGELAALTAAYSTDMALLDDTLVLLA